MAEYIDLEKLLAKIDEAFFETDPDGKEQIGVLKCRAIIREIPAADVAPVVHGRWITWEEAGNDIPSPHRHECSVCHDAAQVLINGIELLSDYCPNCGAIMDGDAERRNT